MIGTTAGDQVSLNGIAALSNGNYVVRSGIWDNGGVMDAGAATFCNGTSGCVGVTVSAANSLVGSTNLDGVGAGAISLTNGNYVVNSPDWHNPAMSNANTGASTFCGGAVGCVGLVSAVNSLTGPQSGDRVGGFAVALTNGNYVVISQNWTNPIGFAIGAGAVTFCSGTSGCTGLVTSANSLVGSSSSDNVGNVSPLTNGNYVVTAGDWNNGAMNDVGAATFCSGTSGCTGPVSTLNSLTGSAANHQVGGFNPALALANGNYVVLSNGWITDPLRPNVGALTPCSGVAGCAGTVSPANSLVGSTANDSLGASAFGSTTALPNGDYVVLSGAWDNAGIMDAGAVTYGLGNAGTVGPITSSNSVRGTFDNAGPSLNFSFSSANNNQMVVGRAEENIVTVFSQGGIPFSAVSRKTHGAAGNFDINLPPTGSPGIECRTGEAGNDFRIVFTFSGAVTFSSASVTSGTGNVSSSSGGGTPNITVDVTGVTNAQTITLRLGGVHSGATTADVSVPMGVLFGDTSGNGTVNSSDVSQTKLRTGQSVDATNFRTDVNVSNSINATDVSSVKLKSRHSFAAASVIYVGIEAAP